MQGFTNVQISEAKAQFYDLLVLLSEFQRTLISSQRSLKPINEAREMIADFLNSILANELIGHFQVLREFSAGRHVSSSASFPLADSTFCTAPSLIFLQDRMGRISYVNSPVTSFFDVTREALLGKTLHELAADLGFSDAIQTAIKTENRIAIKTGRTTNCEIEMASNDGLKRFFFTFHPIDDIDMILCVGTQVKILSTRLAPLQNTQSDCRICHESIQQATLIIDADTSQIIDISDRTADLFRRDRTYLVNHKLARLDLLLSNRLKNALEYLQPDGQVAFCHTIYHQDSTETQVEAICQLTAWNAHIFVLLNVLS